MAAAPGKTTQVAHTRPRRSSVASPNHSRVASHGRPHRGTGRADAAAAFSPGTGGGSPMTTYTWDANALVADWTDTTEWSIAGVPVNGIPRAGDAAAIGAGTVELNVAQLYNVGVTLYQPAQNIAADNVELFAP